MSALGLQGQLQEFAFLHLNSGDQNIWTLADLCSVHQVQKSPWVPNKIRYFLLSFYSQDPDFHYRIKFRNKNKAPFTPGASTLCLWAVLPFWFSGSWAITLRISNFLPSSKVDATFPGNETQVWKGQSQEFLVVTVGRQPLLSVNWYRKWATLNVALLWLETTWEAESSLEMGRGGAEKPESYLGVRMEKLNCTLFLW